MTSSGNCAPAPPWVNCRGNDPPLMGIDAPLCFVAHPALALQGTVRLPSAIHTPWCSAGHQWTGPSAVCTPRLAPLPRGLQWVAPQQQLPSVT